MSRAQKMRRGNLKLFVFTKNLRELFSSCISQNRHLVKLSVSQEYSRSQENTRVTVKQKTLKQQ